MSYLWVIGLLMLLVFLPKIQSAHQRLLSSRLPTQQPRLCAMNETLHRPTNAPCPVCGFMLDGTLAVCLTCELAHHEECWRWVGKCSGFCCGCEITELVPPDPPTAENPESNSDDHTHQQQTEVTK